MATHNPGLRPHPSLWHRARARLLILAAALALLPVPAMAGPGAPGPVDAREVAAWVDPLITGWMEKLHIPGAVVVLVKDGAVLYSRGYGYASLGPERPVTPDRTLWDIGSVTKLFTATAVMQQVEAGTLRLDADVNTYLEAFQVPATFPAPITAHHLLTHTAGFEDRYIGMAARSQEAVRPLGEYLATDLPARVRPPGQFFQYSNHGYALLAHLVETRSGQPFGAYVQQHILAPLAMDRSTFNPTGAAVADLAVSYAYQNGTYRRQRLYPLNVQGAGNLKATAADMARFMLAHLAGGGTATGRILEPVTAALMHEQHHTNHPALDGMTYGFFERTENGRRGLVHGGDDPGGISSLLYLLPEEHLGLFVSLSAQDQGRLRDQLVKELLDRYYPGPESPGPPLAATNPPAAPPVDVTPGGAGGLYLSTRRPYTTFESRPARWLGMAPTERVSLEPDGSLSIIPPAWAPFPAMRLVPVAPLVYESPGGELRVALGTDSQGRIAYLFKGQQVLERLAWYQTDQLALGLLAGTSLIFFADFLLWTGGGVAGLLRRRRPPEGDPTLSWARRAAGVVSSLSLAFWLGLGLALGQDPYALLYGLPWGVRLLFLLPLLAALLTLPLLYLTGLTWRRRADGPGWRVLFSLVTLAAGVQVACLAAWRLLGFHF